MSATTVSETTPVQISGAAVRFSARLGAEPPRYLDVVEDEYGVFGFCSRGVDRKVHADGGERRHGWIIWELPDIYMTGEFHAVWSDGQNMVDITPKPDGETRVLFAPAPRYRPDFDFTLRPHNRLFRTYCPPDRAVIAAGKIGSFTQSQRAYEAGRARKAGKSIEDWMLSRTPEDQKPDLIDEFIAVMEKLHSLTIVTEHGSVLPQTNLVWQLIHRQTSLRAALGI